MTKSRNYTTFDAANVGSNYALELSDTTAHVRNTSSAQIARALYGKSAGIWYVEWVAYGEMDASGSVRFGLADSGTATSQGLGDNAGSIAYRMDGSVWSGNAAIATLPAYDLGDVIGMQVDLDAGRVYWYKKGTSVGDSAIPGSGLWYPACTLVVAQDTDLRALLSAGQRSFEHYYATASGTANRGWFALPDGIGHISVASRPFRTASTDTPPNIRYPGGIADQGLTIGGQLGFWMWAKSRAASSGATLRLHNGRGQFDQLVTQDTRDAAVSLRIVDLGDTLADAQPVATMLVDSVRPIDESSLQVRLRPTDVELDVALQKRLFLPTVDEPMNAKPWPWSCGAVRSIELFAIHAADRILAVNDGPIAGAGALRDRGDPLDPSAADYTIDNATGTVQTATELQGRGTFDMSTLGGDLPVPPSDILGGDGDFTNTADWVDLENKWQVGTDYLSRPILFLTGSGYGYGRINRTVKHASLALQKDKVYKATFELGEFQDTGVGSYNAPPSAYLAICGSKSNGQPDIAQIWGSIYASARDQYFQDLGTAVVVGRALNTGPLWIVAYTGAYGVDKLHVRSLILWELEQEQLDDESLIPATLEHAMRELLEGRCGWTPDRWSAADAAAIDAATGYAGIGLHAASDSGLTVTQALKMLQDAYCACIWTDENNVLRITRLEAPENLTPSGTIDLSNRLDDVKLEPDLAPNLTTRIQARKNWAPLGPSEMVTDDLGLPYTIGGGESTG